MSEDQQNLKRGLNRAAAGLGIVAIGWAIAVLFGHREDDSPIVWAIPVVAALFGLALYSQPRQIGSSQE